jgi:hypothetical protein
VPHETEPRARSLGHRARRALDRGALPGVVPTPSRNPYRALTRIADGRMGQGACPLEATQFSTIARATESRNQIGAALRA